MEKNKKIRNNVLSLLRQYTPEDKVWQKIDSQLEHISKSKMISGFSVVEPPEKIWLKIENELSRIEKISAFKRFEPTESIWENINKELSHGKPNQMKSRIVRWLNWSAAVAAAIIIGLIVYTSTYHKNYSYSVEWVKVQDIQQWNTEDQSVEHALTLICDENPSACSSPEFKELENELAFLDKSKQEIVDQLNRYDDNTELEIKLTEIELERSELIKQMIAKTI